MLSLQSKLYQIGAKLATVTTNCWHYWRPVSADDQVKLPVSTKRGVDPRDACCHIAVICFSFGDQLLDRHESRLRCVL